MKNILTMTLNPAIDKSASVEHVVAERKLACKDPRYEPGGGGVNVSRAIKKLGGQSVLLYAAGGLSGQRLQELLDGEDLNHQGISIAGSVRENLVILEEATGQQYRFGMPGPHVTEPEWEDFLRRIGEITPAPDYLVVSGSLPENVSADFYARAARIGKERGARVIVDTTGEPLKKALAEGVYLIKPNFGEFKDLIGSEVTDAEEDIKAAAQQLIQTGQCQVLVISLGAAGALLVSEELTQHITPPTVPIISKVGAGDSMVAGIVYSLAQGKTLQESVLYGVAAGSAAVMTPGSELCRKDDTERLYKKMQKDHL